MQLPVLSNNSTGKVSHACMKAGMGMRDVQIVKTANRIDQGQDA